MTLEASVAGVDQTLDRIREEMHVAGLERPDMAERVAEALFVDWSGRYFSPHAKDEDVATYAANAKRFGLIFAKTVKRNVSPVGGK